MRLGSPRLSGFSASRHWNCRLPVVGKLPVFQSRLPLDELAAHAVLLLDRAGWHTTGKLDVRQHHADLPAFPRPGAEPGRERLTVSPPELALKYRLRKLRRDRRRRMRGLAKAHRSTRNNHLHRNAGPGSRGSDAMTAGIIARAGADEGCIRHSLGKIPHCASPERLAIFRLGPSVAP